MVVTDPSRPLLPLRFLSAKLAGHPAAAAKLADYAHYSERQFATRALLAEIPTEERTVGIFIEPNSPFGELWLSRPGIRVVPYSAVPDASRLDRDGVRYLILKSKEFAQPDGAPGEDVLAASCLEPIRTVTYVSFTSRGPEPWTLLKRKSALGEDFRRETATPPIPST